MPPHGRSRSTRRAAKMLFIEQDLDGVIPQGNF
jgi:hypothetical protein